MPLPAGRVVTVAALQFHCVADAAANVDRAEALVREAAAKGANLILLQVRDMHTSSHACFPTQIECTQHISQCSTGAWTHIHPLASCPGGTPSTVHKKWSPVM